MRRLLAAALSLCLASPAPAVQFHLPRLFAFDVPPIATGAPLQTPALSASVPVPVDAPVVLAAPATTIAALSRIMTTSPSQDPDRQSAPEKSAASRFSSFFDGSTNFIDGLLRREPRAAAVNAASYLLAVREEHSLPSTSRVLTGAAITALRSFRLDIGHALAEPGFESNISADNRSGAHEIKRLARHIRGIEENHAPAEDGLDSRETQVLGMSVKGRENIEALLEDRAKSAGALISLLREEPNQSRMANRLANSLLGLVTLLATPVIIHNTAIAHAPLLTELARVYLCALLTAVWIITEPYAVLRHRFFRDDFQEYADERTAKFLEQIDPEKWIFNSTIYALRGGLVDALLRHGKTPEGIVSPLWEQDFNSSLGTFGRQLVKMIRSNLSAHQALNDSHYRWVSVDRLLRHTQEGEPEMILIVRSSSSRPRFPKPTRESSWAPEMQLAPIPVRNDEFR